MICRTRTATQKPHERQLEAKVCSSKGVILLLFFVQITMFNNNNLKLHNYVLNIFITASLPWLSYSQHSVALSTVYNAIFYLCVHVHVLSHS